MLTEGSYQELQESNLDFTKLLGSSVKTIIEPETELDTSNNTNTLSNTGVQLDQRPPYKRQISSQSILSSVNELKFNDVQEMPTEEAETRTYGSVSSNVYTAYLSAGGSSFKILFFVFVCIFTQVLASGGDYWMTYWYYT